MFAPTSEQVNPHRQRAVKGSLRGPGEAIHTFYYDIYNITTNSSRQERWQGPPNVVFKSQFVNSGRKTKIVC